MFHNNFHFFCIIQLCVVFLTLAVNLPAYFPKCNQIQVGDDPKDFNQCFMVASNKSREIMKKGIPELGVPSITNITVPKIAIDQKSRAFSYRIEFINITLRGLDSYVIKNFKYDPKTLIYTGTLVLPHLELEGTYYVKGKIFGDEIEQTGPISAVINDTSTDAVFYTEFVHKKNVKYIKITDVKFDMKMGTDEGHFENLFGKNEVLNKATSEFLAQSSKTILDATKPEIEKIIHSLIKSLANRITGLVSYDSAFPPKMS